MRPVLFHWRGVPVHSYPVMLYLGLVVGIVAGDYAANVAGLDSARVVIAMVLLSIPGLLGARLLFVALRWRQYRREPRRLWRRSEGGFAMQGGLPLAVVVSLPLLHALGLPFGAFWDLATLVTLIWLIFGRLGCLLHGCCGGRPTRGWLGLELPDHRGIRCRRVPIQILEAGWAALLLVAAVGLWSRRPFPGAIFLGAAGAYALARVVLQPAREAQDRLGPVNLQRTFAAALGILALLGLIVTWLGSSRNT